MNTQIVTTKDTSLLRALIEAYLVAQGFHRTNVEVVVPDYWGHAELGESRRFIDCVYWQMAREAARGS